MTRLPGMAIAKRGMIFLVFLLYTIYRLYFVSSVAFGQPNLLPVAGGGCSSPYSIYCMYFGYDPLLAPGFF
jgi:hypothetical protein